ncbi:FecR family protein [Desulfobacula phenolica]|uniref:FecR family protein n=1 Tax=Desulfobacula phenolica TaxID=90732 RepID=A0A1H2HXG8_9BACT|nr:FecR family protein [Desulfobacula phenolica]SDU36623.1 FecR family protein [Desulfobacula phenolica]
MEKIIGKKAIVCCLLIPSMLLLFGIPVICSAESGQKLLEKFKSYESDTPLIPEDVTISADFVEGKNEKVGQIQQVQGEAYVIHFGQKTAYRLENDHPLVAKDTLITFPKSRVNALMNDKSVLSLAPQAKLTITKSEYSSILNTRSTVMNLIWGSARFIVKKISGKPDFTVKTKTAVCGVRGTDFVVSVAPAEEGNVTSAFRRFIAYVSPAKKSRISVPEKLITTVLTGPASTVGLTGTIGGTTIIGPLSIAGAIEGAAAGSAIFIGETEADGVLDTVGPELAILSMPPEFNRF